MFKLVLSFSEDEGDHHTWNQSQCYGKHEDIVESLGCLLPLLEGIEDWERCCSNIELELRVVESSSKDRGVDELWVESRNILTCYIDKIVDHVSVVLVVGLIHLIGAISVGEKRLFQPCIIYVGIEISDVLRLYIINDKRLL